MQILTCVLQTSPLTARTLETLIRLSTAHAKARLSNTVDQRDAVAAEEILRFALFKEVMRASKPGKRRKLNSRGGDVSGDEDASGNEDEDEDEDQQPAADAKRMPMPKEHSPTRRQPRRRASSMAADDSTVVDDSGIGMNVDTTVFSSSQALGDESQSQSQPQTESQVPASAPDTSGRAALFRRRVANVFSGRFADTDEVTRETLLPEINLGLPVADLFSAQEADRFLQIMNDDNKIMFR